MSITTLVKEIGQALKGRQWKLVTAESCTGGGLAYEMTGISGSSEWFDRGFVTYSDAAKHDMLGVALPIIKQYGAVSENTARAMAEGALNVSQAQVSIAITGIAGPDGGSVEKPVGTVWFAWKRPAMEIQTKKVVFLGSRTHIRKQSIEFALINIFQMLNVP